MEQVPQWVQADKPNHLGIENICRLVYFITGDPFGDKADRGGQNMEHFAERQPGQKGQTGNNMQIPEIELPPGNHQAHAENGRVMVATVKLANADLFEA